MLYQYDFMAALMELLGIDRPSGWEARSLAPVLRGEPMEEYPYLVYGCGIFSLQRAVRTREYAYVKTFHSGCLPLEPAYLFDIRSDPHQFTDIGREHPQVVAQMESRYAEWWRRWCTGPDAVADPMLAQAPTFSYFPPEQMFRRLEHCGRQDQIEDLKQRLDRNPYIASVD
jgi:arylsulfatase A-like enzyme